jgi:iron complex outermembrane receptor protein
MGSQGQYLPFMPPPRVLSRIAYDLVLGKQTVVRTITFKMDIVHSWAQNQYLGLYHTETPTTAYTLFNMGVYIDIRYTKDKTLQLQLQGNNLINTAYQDHLSRLQYFEYYSASPTGHLGIYNMGRNICLRIIFNIL